MNATILVTGGTGTLGRVVTPLLRDTGAQVRVFSRRSREPSEGVEYLTGDLATGAGVERAVAGVKTVLHLAGGANAKGDEMATRNLVWAASRAGVRHFVFVSVVGAGRVPVAYMRRKLHTEQMVAESGMPWTTVRVAQVDDLILTLVEKMAKLPVIPVPGGVRMEPIDARDVAERLAELTLGAPAGLVPELAGPQVYGMGELIRGYLRTQGKRRPLLPVRVPGKAGRAYRAGDNLAAAGADVGKRTWDDFLAGHVG